MWKCDNKKWLLLFSMRSSGLYEKPEASITGPQKACSPIVCILITERIFNLKLEKIKLEIRN